MPNRPLAHRSSRASRSGGSARWASAITRTGACSSWSRAKAPPVRKERPKKLPAFVSGSVTSRWRPSRSRPSPCSAPAAPCALGAGCQWSPPPIPARSRTVPARSSDPSTADAQRLLARLPELRLPDGLHCAYNSQFLATVPSPPPDELRVVEHGLRFNTAHKLRTVIWDFAGEPLPGDLCGDVERALAGLQTGALADSLLRLLSPAEVDMLRRRLRGVLDPGWRFPEPTSAWSIPWPPI